MSTRNILDDVFSMDEEAKETFMEAVEDSYGEEDERVGLFDKTPAYGVSIPQLVTKESGYIRLLSGPVAGKDGDPTDYVWHIAPNHPKKPWKARPEHLLLAVQKVFSTVVPDKNRVWIWGPDPEWEIAEWSFKAVDILSDWSVTIDDISIMNEKLLEICNSLV